MSPREKKCLDIDEPLHLALLYPFLYIKTQDQWDEEPRTKTEKGSSEPGTRILKSQNSAGTRIQSPRILQSLGQSAENAEDICFCTKYPSDPSRCPTVWGHSVLSVVSTDHVFIPGQGGGEGSESLWGTQREISRTMSRPKMSLGERCPVRALV